ncbi:winged helix DNA-binding protein [Sphingomonas fuzhouensis]|uniref:winged helix DNA-binding protein n=1 Tax=Sphingomonas fuzhouensis TaxID=3106033 RepID=UPI002AFF6BE8|nr:winged helix DNA-binding protein [Sphingomonas sp. SGZ-02]
MDDQDLYGTGFAVVVIGVPALAMAAGDMVRQAGGRVLRTVDWSAVAEEIGQQAGRPLLLVDTHGAEAATMEIALARIDAVATALDLPIVVSLATADIDLVAAMLLGPRVAMLCDASPLELVAALAIAGANNGGATMLHAHVREGESERLRKLNAEVARIAEALTRLSVQEDEDLRGGVSDRHQSFHAAPPRPQPGDAELVRRMIRARRLRDGFFGGGLFEEPAWDMLLDLYAAQLEGTRVSVSSLCIAAAVAPTTALRWIGKMTEAGLFARQPDPADRRRAFMVLTDAALEGMRGYLNAIRRLERP